MPLVTFSGWAVQTCAGATRADDQRGAAGIKVGESRCVVRCSTIEMLVLQQSTVAQSQWRSSVVRKSQWYSSLTQILNHIPGVASSDPAGRRSSARLWRCQPNDILHVQLVDPTQLCNSHPSPPKGSDPSACMPHLRLHARCAARNAPSHFTSSSRCSLECDTAHHQASRSTTLNICLLKEHY